MIIEVFNALGVAMKWLEQRHSTDPVQFLLLKRLRTWLQKKPCPLHSGRHQEFLFPIKMIFFIFVYYTVHACIHIKISMSRVMHNIVPIV